ncbi:MAG: NAD(P)H-dependent glycerol-3-phosphate dehydrogenase [Phycisphaerales bacterium]
MGAPTKGTTGSNESASLSSVAVLGLGQMALVSSAMLLASGTVSKVTLWDVGHSELEAGRLAQTRTSPRLPGFMLPEGATIARDAARSLEGADVIVSAIPTQFIRQTWTTLARRHKALLGRGASGPGIVSVAKGIEVATRLTPTRILADVLYKEGVDGLDEPPRAIATLSGPTIAAELARGLPAAMVAASDDARFAERVQSLFGTSWTRVYTNRDVLGVELSGAVKNVIAIAAGVIDGLRAGSNAKSALLARGLAEIVRLGTAMGANTETFFGVAGVGDLATTCFSPEGRNRSLGEAIGKGANLQQYLAESESVVEGVETSRAVMALAQTYRVEMPICAAVHAVLFEGLDPVQAIQSLMARESKPERVG